MGGFFDYLETASTYVLIITSLLIVLRCFRSMLSERYEPETWAYIRAGKETIPVTHWESIIGRSRSADIRVDRPGISRTHAVLVRSDNDIWSIYDIFSKGGVWVNGHKVGTGGTCIFDGDVLNLGGQPLRFADITTEKREKLEKSRPETGKNVSPLITLLDLTLFQLFLLLQQLLNCKAGHRNLIAMGFAGIIILQWLCYAGMKLMKRRGFELETLAFYLTTLGMSVTASASPDGVLYQLILSALAVLLFLLTGWWLRKLSRTASVRIFIAVLAAGLLALNVLAGSVENGARNWLQFAGFSFQPSELVKVAFVYVGASTLDRLYRNRNLFAFIAFSAACVIALALIGDFGTALVFFAGFLVISFMRSGSIATVVLAVSSAVIAGVAAVSVRPYIASRFETWRHVWDDVFGAGYQQACAMSAAAAGGLFGKGAGAGWLKQVVAADTDMVFAVLCEETGLIIALLAVMAVVIITFFAVRSAGGSRSSFYAISACAAAGMMLVQLSLNVFGTMDILPFTGVTFPFVSKGGTSLVSCWMLLAFIKAADSRKGASFAVRPVKNIVSYKEVDAEEYSFSGGETE